MALKHLTCVFLGFVFMSQSHACEPIHSFKLMIQSTDPTCEDYLVRLLKHKNSDRRLEAARELSNAQWDIEKAVPVIVSNFDQKYGEEGISYALYVAAYGEAAVDYLQEPLASKNWLVRKRACIALRNIYGGVTPEKCK